jgi:hypothetical protein
VLYSIFLKPFSGPDKKKNPKLAYCSSMLNFTNSGRSWGGKKNLLRKGSFSPPQTPPLFSKPFSALLFLHLAKPKVLLKDF